MTGRHHRRLFGAVMRLVPYQWRDQVRRDLTADDGSSRSRWAVLEAAAIGLNLHWAFTREGVVDVCRLAVRRLAKRPGASLVSLVTLALSIGAAAATWSLMSAVLLNPVPARDPDRLVAIGYTEPGAKGGVSLRTELLFNMEDFFGRAGVFEDLAAGGFRPLTIVADAKTIKTDMGYIASGNFFELLGIHAALGRGLTKADASNGSSVAVLSDRFWRRQFNKDPDVVGRTISVNQRPVTIVGVMPREFRGIDLARSPDIYLPMNPASPITWVTFVGRLREGATLAQTVTHLRAVPQPAEWRFNPTFDCIPLQTAAIPEASRAGMARFTQLLGAAVGLLLLIGTLTVGMLLLVRTEARRDEFAMCLALGATPARLAAGVAVEGAMLALAGSALSIPMSWWLLAGIRAYQLPGAVQIDLLNLSIDQRALAATAVAAVAGGIVIVLVAGVFGFSANVADTLRSRSGVTAPLTRRRTRATLVAAQIAVALVLLSGAGLFARSVKEALHINPGFDTAHTLTGWVSYPPEREPAFLAGLSERLSVNPAIQALSFTYPQGGMTVAGTLAVDGIDRRFPTFVAFNFVDERYFTAMGIHILNGRDFTAEDRATAPRVAIVSESLGRFVGNGRDPLGRRIQDLSPTTTIQVVGVAPDVITKVSALEPLTMYMPIAQARHPRDRDLVVKSADPASAAREIAAAVKAGDPSAQLSPMLTMDERITEQMSAQRFGIVIMSALGGIAALLTVLGIYVLAESMAVLRIREMGIRAALGATGRQLGSIVLAEIARLVGLGIGAGLAIAWAGTGLIRSLLFRVRPLDPTTIGGVAVAIAVVAIVVSLKPAVRAARVDLASVLRDE